MKGESDVIRSIIDELDSSDMQGDQLDAESMVLLKASSMYFIPRISKEIQWRAKEVSHEVSVMNLILWISNDIKWKVKVVLIEVSLMNFILGISKEIKWKMKA